MSADHPAVILHQVPTEAGPTSHSVGPTPVEAGPTSLVAGQPAYEVGPTPLPKHLFGWLPYLWTRVLFVGTSQAPTRVRMMSLLILLLLPGVLLYPTRSFHLLEPDEGRYAQIPKEMLDRGAWVVPTLQGQPYLDKPPLTYWLIRLSYTLFGVSEASARLVPALAVHWTILFVYLIGRLSLGERSAFWGALLLSVAPGFIGMGRLLLLDGVLTCCVTLMTLSAWEAVRQGQLRWGWWMLAAVACGLGILTKGPIAWILLVPPLVAQRWLTQLPIWIGWRPVLAFLAVTSTINFPWYISILLHEPIFLKYFFWDHNIMRFVQPFDHLQPVWFYVPVLIGGLMPTIFLLPSLVKFLTTGDAAVAQQRTLALGFFLLSGGWCIVFFSLSGCKLPTYVLPAFPMVLLAFGDLIARSRWEASAWPRVGVVTMGLLLAGAFYWGLPWYAERRSPMGRPELVQPYLADATQPILCYPRNCDSVAFYLNRADLRSFRSKDITPLMLELMKAPRSVVLFSHRHSLASFRHSLPPELRIVDTQQLQLPSTGWAWLDRAVGETPWGLCHLAVVEVVPMHERPYANQAVSRPLHQQPAANQAVSGPQYQQPATRQAASAPLQEQPATHQAVSEPQYQRPAATPAAPRPLGSASSSVPVQPLHISSPSSLSSSSSVKSTSSSSWCVITSLEGLSMEAMISEGDFSEKIVFIKP